MLDWVQRWCPGDLKECFERVIYLEVKSGLCEAAPHRPISHTPWQLGSRDPLPFTPHSPHIQPPMMSALPHTRLWPAEQHSTNHHMAACQADKSHPCAPSLSFSLSGRLCIYLLLGKTHTCYILSNKASLYLRSPNRVPDTSHLHIATQKCNHNKERIVWLKTGFILIVTMYRRDERRFYSEQKRFLKQFSVTVR